MCISGQVEVTAAAGDKVADLRQEIAEKLDQHPRCRARGFMVEGLVWGVLERRRSARSVPQTSNARVAEPRKHHI